MKPFRANEARVLIARGDPGDLLGYLAPEGLVRPSFVGPRAYTCESPSS